MRNTALMTLCALLVSAVLFHTSAYAHSTTTDSKEPVELGSVFQFLVSKKVTRQVCPERGYIEMALADISRMSTPRAHHFLFHDANRREGTGTQKLKRGYSPKTEQVLVDHCKGIGPTKFAPVEVIKTIDVRGYKVDIVAIYMSYRDKEAIFYTWFVNTELVEQDLSEGVQMVANKNITAISAPVFAPAGFLLTSERSLVEEVLSSAASQPEPVGQRVLLNPRHVSFMEYDARSYFKELAKRGWIHEYKEKDLITFDEFIESRVIHGMTVSIVAVDAETEPAGETQRFYTWLVNTEIMGSGGKRLAKGR